MKPKSKKSKLRKKKARSKIEAKRPHHASSDEQESLGKVKKRRKLRKKRHVRKHDAVQATNEDASLVKAQENGSLDEEIIDGFR